MQDKESDEVCSVCGGKTEGEFTVRETDAKDGAGFTIAIVGSSDRDFNDCDGCNARVHWRCSKRPHTGYCDWCFEKYGLEEPDDPFLFKAGARKN
jgi:hypothetical protein